MYSSSSHVEALSESGTLQIALPLLELVLPIARVSSLVVTGCTQAPPIGGAQTITLFFVKPSFIKM